MKYRILIVEDNLAFAISMEEKLHEWDHDVIGIIDNGNEAIETIQKENPDIILMDINIKGDFNGIEVAHSVKELDSSIIFVTGEKDENIFNAATNTKGISYLVKPFDMLSLRGAVELATINKVQKAIKPNDSMQIEIQSSIDASTSDTKKLYFRKKKELIQIDLIDLNWMESDRNYCDLYTKDQRFTIRISLRRLQELLPTDKFIKVHKRFIVRLDAIDKVVLSKNQIHIGENIIFLGRKFRTEFLDRIRRIR